jgi:hypothetical protein
MWLAIIGIGLEIVGFLLVIKSTKRLDLEDHAFMGPRYIDPKTKQPPPHIELPKSAAISAGHIRGYRRLGLANDLACRYTWLDMIGLS